MSDRTLLYVALAGLGAIVVYEVVVKKDDAAPNTALQQQQLALQMAQVQAQKAAADASAANANANLTGALVGGVAKIAAEIIPLFA